MERAKQIGAMRLVYAGDAESVGKCMDLVRDA
jgi:hypothetical protein